MPRSVMRPEQEVTILELLDRALDKGVVLWGEVVISVADVDLVYVGLKVLLSSVETANRMRYHMLPDQEDPPAS